MDDQRAQNRKMVAYGAGLVVVIAAAAGSWAWMHRKPEPQPVITPPAETATPAPTEDPVATIEHPVEPVAEAAAQPLPELAQSDSGVAEALRGVFGAPAVESWLVPDEVLRRFVASIDNLPRNVPLEKRRPLRAPAEAFLVDRTSVDAAAGTERITLSARNAGRYDAAVALFTETDPQMLVALYRRWYPLLQQAYEDLGYPDRYFNDRMVAVIDDMLRAPDVRDPIVLVQPKVLYQFEDPRLEQLSSGQKLLLRMGPGHATAVKSRLRELRALITAPAANKPAARTPAAN
jgi:hypothetical protein